MADYALERRRSASSLTDAELQKVLESGLLRGGLVALEETLKTKDQTIAALRQMIEAMRGFNNRLAEQVEELITMANGRLDRIYELEDAARDVLPTLESNWRGERPIPAWHPTAALRTKLEENK